MGVEDHDNLVLAADDGNLGPDSEIRLKVDGSQIAHFDSDTLELDKVVWDDEKIVTGAFQFAGVSDPTLSDWQPGGVGTIYKVYKFQDGDEVFMSCQLSHKYKEGEDALKTKYGKGELK